jgi:hypothetical protein
MERQLLLALKPKVLYLADACKMRHAKFCAAALVWSLHILSYTVLHCSCSVHCTVLLCLVLHVHLFCTVLHALYWLALSCLSCTGSHYMPLSFTILHCPQLLCFSLSCTYPVLACPIRHRLSLSCTVLNYSDLHCPACPVWVCTIGHCLSLSCTVLNYFSALSCISCTGFHCRALLLPFPALP